MKGISKKRAATFLDGIDSINWGGCLLSAYAFYLNEKAKGNKDFEKLQIAQMDWSENSLCQLTNKNFIENKAKKADSACHFGWTYDGGRTVEDSGFAANYEDGLKPSSRFSAILVVPKHLTEIFCVSSLNNGKWNRAFDRKHYLPKIEKFFNLDLSEIWVNRKGRNFLKGKIK